MRILSVLLLCFLIFQPAFAKKNKPASTLSNEKVYIEPVIDSSLLQTFPGWPKDQPSQALLAHHFPECQKNLFAEFKRCEKFGLYEMTDNASSATVQIRLTICPFSYKNSVLTFPVRMEMRRNTGIDPFSDTLLVSAQYRAASKPKSPFHLLDYLLADFRRHFPYKSTVALFYAAP